MKKMLLLVAGAMLALSFVPAHADPTNGCVAGDPSANGAPVSTGGLTCSYTAKGAGQYVAATPNSYSITVTHNGVAKKVVDSDSLTPPAQGTIPAAAGDVVTLTVGPDDAVITSGSIGLLAAHDAA